MNERSAKLELTPAAQVRWVAAEAIYQVLGHGRALDAALEPRLARFTDPRDRGLAQEIAYGVLRVLPRLQGYAQVLLERPLKSRDLVVECLLWVGLYQLDALRVPDHAAIAETVAATHGLGVPWARGVLNAVLRNFQRRRAAVVAAAEQAATVKHCFPAWLLERLQSAWPADWERLVVESNRHAPMALRVNLGRVTRSAYAQQLASAGLVARPIAEVPGGLVLDQPAEVTRLPGFAAGEVSVQDGAAQLAVPLLAAAAGQQILDACAAPGGKTGQILECWPAARVTAVDRQGERLKSVHGNLRRLGCSARLLRADITVPGAWADRLYDRILLDVPCSATGVIRRHPDIKWLRRDTDIAQLAAEQAHMLDVVWPQLCCGGRLVYVTCSLLPEENHVQILDFLRRTPDARAEPLNVTWGRECAVGRQLLTGEAGGDGFYFASLTRIAAIAT